VSALWTVSVLLAILVVANSIAVIALTRQVGLLHLRMAPPPRRQPPGGLQPGSHLQLDLVGFLGVDPAPDLVLLGFVRPACSACTAALPAFAAVASGLVGNEKVLLVSDADEATAQGYLTAHGVSLPLAAGPHLLSASGIPAVPYAVVADAAGNVLAAQNAGSAQQLQDIMSHARQSRQAATPNVTAAPDGIRGGTVPPPEESSKEERDVV
jgi:hypothetical protein